jgi:hypothetical protein
VPEVGLDVARFGDDNTEAHVRAGPASLRHEAHNGLGNNEVVGLLRNMCRWCADWANERRDPQAAPIRPDQIRCKVDDDGMGGRITDFADGYNWVPVRAGNACSGDYPNVRSELWFVTAERARKGLLSLASLPEKVRRELKRQAVAPHYKLDAAGRRVVEPKQDTKDTLGRSPDGMDALNLAYYEGGGIAPAEWVGGTREHRSVRDRHKG